MPPRSGPTAYSPPRSSLANAIPTYEGVKARVLAKVRDRLDLSKSRRMPPSLFQETARQVVEQAVESEGSRLTRADRDRLIDEAVSEAFGYGPLEELFADPAVKEVLVLGPGAVLARRDDGWLPTNVKFRDLDQFNETLEKASTHGDFVGSSLPDSALDLRLGNGFRLVAIVPPAATGQPPIATFVRIPDPLPRSAPAAAGVAEPPKSGLRTPLATPALGSPGLSASRATAGGAPMTLDRHRARIIEKMNAKLASFGAHDLSRIDPANLRKAVAAYVIEYCQMERVLLSGTEEDRLTLEVLAAIKR